MKTILLVDDEDALLDTLADLLRDDGYRIVLAANGRDGLAQVVQEKPDLVIVDFMMPISSGRELVRGMRALPEFGSTPVIMMSGANMDVALAEEDGTVVEVSHFIPKPFDFRDLMDAIVQLVGPGERKPRT
jgi:CheY-like chemotaxis protein